MAQLDDCGWRRARRGERRSANWGGGAAGWRRKRRFHSGGWRVVRGDTDCSCSPALLQGPHQLPLLPLCGIDSNFTQTLLQLSHRFGRPASIAPHYCCHDLHSPWASFKNVSNSSSAQIERYRALRVLLLGMWLRGRGARGDSLGGGLLGCGGGLEKGTMWEATLGE